jgi:hypothetical protein
MGDPVQVQQQMSMGHTNFPRLEDPEDYALWKIQFQARIKTGKITDDGDIAAMLIQCLNMQILRDLHAQFADGKLLEKDSATLLATLDRMYTKEKLELAKKAHLFELKQKGRPLEDYATECKRMANQCNWEKWDSEKAAALTFVIGLDDGNIRKHLLMHGEEKDGTTKDFNSIVSSAKILYESAAESAVLGQKQGVFAVGQRKVPLSLGRNQLKCWNCQGNHIRRDCPKQYCGKCGKQGHHSMNCKSRGNGKSVRTSNSSSESGSDSDGSQRREHYSRRPSPHPNAMRSNHVRVVFHNSNAAAGNNGQQEKNLKPILKWGSNPSNKTYANVAWRQITSQNKSDSTGYQSTKPSAEGRRGKEEEPRIGTPEWYEMLDWKIACGEEDWRDYRDRVMALGNGKNDKFSTTTTAKPSSSGKLEGRVMARATERSKETNLHARSTGAMEKERNLHTSECVNDPAGTASWTPYKRPWEKKRMNQASNREDRDKSNP